MGLKQRFMEGLVLPLRIGRKRGLRRELLELPGRLGALADEGHLLASRDALPVGLVLGLLLVTSVAARGQAPQGPAAAPDLPDVKLAIARNGIEQASLPLPGM